MLNFDNMHTFSTGWFKKTHQLVVFGFAGGKKNQLFFFWARFFTSEFRFRYDFPEALFLIGFTWRFMITS